VVTEAGFGADLGAEKFFDIKCRKAGLKPSATVVVATVRALKMHGGVAKGDLGKENVAAVKAGCSNLARHIKNMKSYGVPVVVAINQFVNDTNKELNAVRATAKKLGAKAIVASHWANGGEGTKELATEVVKLVDSGKAKFKVLYPDSMSLENKMRTIAQKLYGAKDIAFDGTIAKRFAELEAGGYGKFPICVAKTQYSFSTNPDAKGAPSGHIVPVRELRLSAGAEFIVAVTGDIMTMPGLPSKPAANNIYLNKKGQIEGLF
jgi:formate--tetrahydrofolate ligase